MSDEEGSTGAERARRSHGGSHASSGGAVYGLGFVGALVYFLQHATSFGNGVLGVLEALVWPAVVIYKLLAFLA